MGSHRLLFYSCLFFGFFVLPLTAADTVVRAAVDIGSGATKLRVAEVNLKTNKIEKILVTESFAVPYQEQLSRSSNSSFDEEVMAKGLDALKKSADIAKKYGAERVIGVATAAFRKANNANIFIDRIARETGIKVHVIDQQLEGDLAFQIAQSQFDVPPSHLIVWDIGGGSFQLTGFDRQGGALIYRGHEASIPFRNYVIEQIKREDIQKTSTPNPLTSEESQMAKDHAKKIAEKVDRVFREKISQPNTVVVGVGNIFSHQIFPMLGKKSTITLDELKKSVESLVNKTDKEVGGGDFANVYVTNAILIEGFMRSLGIEKMQIADINPADGALLYAAFWKERKIERIGLKKPRVYYEERYMGGCF